VLKMLRRHPHVFGSGKAAGIDAVNDNWERIKANERAEKNDGSEPPSALDGVAHALPALARAAKLQRRASRVGFDWGAPEPILDKIAEEIAEMSAELPAGDKGRITDELGDVLSPWSIWPPSRHRPRSCATRHQREVRTALQIYRARAPRHRQIAGGLDLEEMDALWRQAKTMETTTTGS